jgi:hypothetical protein
MLYIHCFSILHWLLVNCSNEPLGTIKCRKFLSSHTTGSLLSRADLLKASWLLCMEIRPNLLSSSQFYRGSSAVAYNAVMLMNFMLYVKI